MYDDKRKIVNHMKIHVQNGYTSICTICGIKYKNFVKHMRYSHNIKRPFKCELCNAALSRASELKLHMRLHTGERPYKCECCDESFKCHTSYRYHKILKHNIGQSHICEQCNRPFVTKKYLNDHIISSHLKIKTHECKHCGKMFTLPRNLKTHVKIHDPLILNCKYCPNKFTTNKDRRKHERTQHEWHYNSTANVVI